MRASIKRSIPATRVWLGPNGSFYAEDGIDGWCEDIPPVLEDFIQRSTITWTNRVSYLTLGYNGGFFVVFQDGEFWYDLTASAKALDGVLDEVLQFPAMLGRKNHPVKIYDMEVRPLPFPDFSPMR